MQNINVLRNELSEVFQQLKSGTIEVKTAEALNNTAGKVMSTVIAELKYRAITESKDKIPFLEYTTQNSDDSQ